MYKPATYCFIGEWPKYFFIFRLIYTWYIGCLVRNVSELFVYDLYGKSKECCTIHDAWTVFYEKIVSVIILSRLYSTERGRCVAGGADRAHSRQWLWFHQRHHAAFQQCPRSASLLHGEYEARLFLKEAVSSSAGRWNNTHCTPDCKNTCNGAYIRMVETHAWTNVSKLTKSADSAGSASKTLLFEYEW